MARDQETVSKPTHVILEEILKSPTHTLDSSASDKGGMLYYLDTSFAWVGNINKLRLLSSPAALEDHSLLEEC